MLIIGIINKKIDNKNFIDDIVNNNYNRASNEMTRCVIDLFKKEKFK